MTTLTIQQYNDIKKEAIDKFIKHIESEYSDHLPLMALLYSQKKEVFDKLDKRQEKQKRRGSTLIHITTHGVIE